MNGYVLAAGILSILMGIGHAVLGEVMVLNRLCGLAELPPVLGSARFTGRILRFTWHITTALLLAFGGVLAVLSGAPPSREGALILDIAAANFLLCALVSGVITRGKHFSWAVFAVIAALVWFGAR